MLYSEQYLYLTILHRCSFQGLLTQEPVKFTFTKNYSNCQIPAGYSTHDNKRKIEQKFIFA